MAETKFVSYTAVSGRLYFVHYCRGGFALRKNVDKVTANVCLIRFLIRRIDRFCRYSVFGLRNRRSFRFRDGEYNEHATIVRRRIPVPSSCASDIYRKSRQKGSRARALSTARV